MSVERIGFFGIQIKNEIGNFVWTESIGQKIADILERVTQKFESISPSIAQSDSQYHANGKNLRLEEDDRHFQKRKLLLDKRVRAIETNYDYLVNKREWFLYIKKYLTQLPSEFHSVRMKRIEEIDQYLQGLEQLLFSIGYKGEGWVGKMEQYLQHTLPKDTTYFSYSHIQALGREILHLGKLTR